MMKEALKISRESFVTRICAKQRSAHRLFHTLWRTLKNQCVSIVPKESLQPPEMNKTSWNQLLRVTKHKTLLSVRFKNEASKCGTQVKRFITSQRNTESNKGIIYIIHRQSVPSGQTIITGAYCLEALINNVWWPESVVSNIMIQRPGLCCTIKHRVTHPLPLFVHFWHEIKYTVCWFVRSSHLIWPCVTSLYSKNWLGKCVFSMTFRPSN